jgi:crotonobetainyl-CoA:carnitine CoA-transferase CaiB-like acyl-CoA transferase
MPASDLPAAIAIMAESAKGKRSGPLSGIRILDAAQLLAAPTAATLLSEYGAEIIKIEQPKVGDPMRKYPPFAEKASLLWKVIGRNRQSVTLDLRTEKGRDVLKRLAAKSDVVILNYRPETMAKWGIDFDDLVKVKSDIIVMHLTAYGRSGPYADRPGFARVAEAFAGLTHRTGFPDQEPVQAGYPMLGDGITGIYGAFALMLALKERDLTGKPQLIDLALYEPLLRIFEDQIATFGETGVAPTRVGNSSPLISPNGLFPTKDGRYVCIPASTEPIYRRLVGLIGDPSLLAYDSNPARIQHRDLVEGKVTEWTRKHNMLDLVEICAAAGVACGAVYSAEEIVRDRHMIARGSVISVPDAETGRQVQMASPAGRFSEFEGQVRHTGPALGEHTESVLRDELGMSPEQIAALRDEGVI